MNKENINSSNMFEASDETVIPTQELRVELKYFESVYNLKESLNKSNTIHPSKSVSTVNSESALPVNTNVVHVPSSSNATVISNKSSNGTVKTPTSSIYSTPSKKVIPTPSRTPKHTPLSTSIGSTSQSSASKKLPLSAKALSSLSNSNPSNSTNSISTTANSTMKKKLSSSKAGEGSVSSVSSGSVSISSLLSDMNLNGTSRRAMLVAESQRQRGIARILSKHGSNSTTDSTNNSVKSNSELSKNSYNMTTPNRSKTTTSTNTSKSTKISTPASTLKSSGTSTAVSGMGTHQRTSSTSSSGSNPSIERINSSTLTGSSSGTSQGTLPTVGSLKSLSSYSKSAHTNFATPQSRPKTANSSDMTSTSSASKAMITSALGSATLSTPTRPVLLKTKSMGTNASGNDNKGLTSVSNMTNTPISASSSALAIGSNKGIPPMNPAKLFALVSVGQPTSVPTTLQPTVSNSNLSNDERNQNMGSSTEGSIHSESSGSLKRLDLTVDTSSDPNNLNHSRRSSVMKKISPKRVAENPFKMLVR